MKINEVDDIKLDEDGSSYRQSFVEQLIEARDNEWEDSEDISEYSQRIKQQVENGIDDWWK